MGMKAFVYDIVEDVILGKSKVYHNKSPSGTGKTYTILEYLNVQQRFPVIVSFANHDLLTQVMEKLVKSKGINYLHVKGRNLMCINPQKKAVIDSLIKRNIFTGLRSICKKCGDQCGYLQMIEESKNYYGYVACVHQHLNGIFHDWTKVSQGSFPHFRLLIIEESFLDSLMSIKTFNIRHLKDGYKYVQKKYSGTTLELFLKEILNSFEGNSNGTDIVDYLDSFDYFDRVKYELSLLKYKSKHNMISPLIDISRASGGDFFKFDNSIKYNDNSITISKFMNPFAYDDLSIVVNDASTPTSVYRSVFFPRDVERYSKVPLVNNFYSVCLSQKFGRVGLRSLKRDNYKKFWKYCDLLNEISEYYFDKKLVVFIQKKLKDLLESQIINRGMSNVSIEYYYGSESRGSNNYINHNVVILFGAPLVSLDELDFTSTIFDIGGNVRSKMITESEMYQASCRIRPFTHGKDKVVIILSSLDIYDSEVMSFNDMYDKFSNLSSVKSKIIEQLRLGDKNTNELRQVIHISNNRLLKSIKELVKDKIIKLIPVRNASGYQFYPYTLV